MAVHHIVNLHTYTPEVQCRYNCFIEIGHQSLLFSLANSFTLAIAVDRFYATVLPLRYKQLFENTGSLKTENPMLMVCTFTMVTGRYSFYILCCKWLFFGLSSIILYFIAILFVKTRQNKIFVVTGITTTPSSLEVIKQKHSKQLFKALVLHSIVQACTLIVCYSKLLYGAIVQSDRGSTDGPYFTILNTTSGLSNFVIYLICLKVFRQNCRVLISIRTNTIAPST
uniref:Vomeronasal type-1 receptor n=1 Tax=Romanomermis culicivorax TaxID=13658 RepID=A0A915IE36_ROMCU